MFLSPFLQPHVPNISPTGLILPQTRSAYIWDNLIDKIFSNFKRTKLTYEPIVSHLSAETDLHSRELAAAHNS